MLSRISLSTYGFVGSMLVGTYLLATDFCDGKYDFFGPYPRNPKRDDIAPELKKILAMEEVNNRRYALFEPVIDHLNPCSTPDPVNY